MISLLKASELKGAQSFGQCLSCGIESGKTEIYVIRSRLSDSSNYITHRLCWNCLKDLEYLIGVEHQSRVEMKSK